jgi:hypothetical protein
MKFGSRVVAANEIRTRHVFQVPEQFGDQLSQLYMFTHIILCKGDAISTKCSANLYFRIGQERKTTHPFPLKPKIPRR